MKTPTLAQIATLAQSLKPNHQIFMSVDVKGRGNGDHNVFLQYTHQSDTSVFAKDRYGQEYEIVNMARIHNALQAENFHQKISKVTSMKTPQDKDRHLGIELEFISQLNHQEITLAMVEAGVEDFVELKDDGSIDTDDDYGYSHELCVLVKESQLEDVIKRICKALAGNSSVNKSCGMHVHVDMRGRNPRSAYKNLFEMQPILYAMCPKSRRIGTYSQPEISYEPFDEDADFEDMSRYHGVNRAAYGTHETLEVRVHSGTLDARKIILWARLLVKIADKRTSRAERATMKRELAPALESLKLESDLQAYVVGRIEKFKSQHETSNIKVVA